MSNTTMEYQKVTKIEDLDPVISDFDAARLANRFEQCISNPGISMDIFIHCFEEFSILLNRLGTIFSFITMDIKDKLCQLREQRSAEFKQKLQIENFATVKSMLDYELANNKINFKTKIRKNAAGTRNICCLFRAMAMLYKFISKLIKNECNGRVSIMAWEAYADSPLHNFHPWIVRNTVKVAVYTLPTRDQFFAKAVPELSQSDTEVLLTRVGNSMEILYENIEKMYKPKGCNDLP